MKRVLWLVLAGSVLLVLRSPAPACSICGLNAMRTPTYRQDLADARLILYGVITKSQLLPGTSPGDVGKGVSDFEIKSILKSDPWLGNRTTIEIPRYVPVGDGKEPPKYLLFCTVVKDSLEVFRGVPVKSEAAIAYVKGLLTANEKGTADVLRHCFEYLEHPDRELATDAYLEFAKTSDADLAGVAPKLSADKLRGWLKDSNTPDQHLGIYALLLGGCGGEADAQLLRKMIEGPSDRAAVAFDGLLAGYIQLRPRDGWELALSVLKDDKRSFTVRFAVVRMLRFYHAWKADETREQVMRGMATILRQSDIADIAVEDLRRWKEWDLTADVLAVYGKKGYDAPLVQRALVRYALSCPREEARRFTEDLRRKDPALYRDVYESLEFDKK